MRYGGSGRYFFFGRDSIGMTRLSVFLWRRSSFTFMRRFFDAFVRGLPFIVGSFSFCDHGDFGGYFLRFPRLAARGLLAVGANSP
jgi:hypothetical protein